MDAVGLASSIVSLIEFGIKVVERIKAFQEIAGNDLPPSYQQLKMCLPLLIESLEDTKQLLKYQNLSESQQKALSDTISGCQTQITSLNEILLKVLPEEGDSRASRGKKALKSLFNDSELKDIAAALLSYVQTMTYYHTSSGQISSKRRELHEQIWDWLAAPRVEEDLKDALSQYCRDTGTWFLGGDAYAKWKDTSIPDFSSRWLWLRGSSGTGKTILASKIVATNMEESTPPRESEKRTPVVYYFFSFKDVEKQTSHSMLRSILAQLLPWCDPLPENLYASGLGNKDAQRKPTGSELLQKLRLLLEKLPVVYIVLDALDECTDLDELWKIFECFKESHARVLVTSQRKPLIEQSLSFIDFRQIVSLEPTIVDKDIKIYVGDRIRHDPKLSRWSKRPKVQEEIETFICNRSSGMFRWAACQLDSIAKCVTYKMLQKALVQLPRTLEETYERILLEIDEEYIDIVVRVLRWLSFASRPLLLKELSEAIAMDSVDGSFDKDDALEDPRDIFLLCSALIRVGDRQMPGFQPDMDKDHQAPVSLESWLRRRAVTTASDSSSEPNEAFGDWNDGGDGDYGTYSEYIGPSEEIFKDRYSIKTSSNCIVTLAHSSVKEYLLSERILQTPASAFSLQETRSQLILAKSSIGYLLQFEDPSYFSDHSRLQHHLGEFKMAGYCAQFWSSHAQSVDQHGITEEKSELDEFILSFFAKPETSYLCSLMIWNWDHHPYLDYQTEWPRPLYCACRNKLKSIVPKLLQQGAEINAPTGMLGTALSAAAFEGHLDIVEVLLEAGADVEAKGHISGGSLQASMFNENPKVSERILASGADVNFFGGFYGYPLQAAAAEGRADLVELMLKNGAHVDAEGGFYGSALQAAASRGHSEIVSVLLDAETKVEHGFRKESSLRAAATTGNANVVRLLLDAGADVHFSDRYSSTALASASYWGHSEIVEILLSAGADVNADGGFEGTALCAAALEGHSSIVARLLEAGADPNHRVQSPPSPYQFALHAASKRGIAYVVSMLLQAGADVNACDQYQRTAFGIASQHHRWACVYEIFAVSGVSAEEPEAEAMDQVADEDMDALKRLLSRAGADVGKYLHLKSESSIPGREHYLESWLYKADKHFVVSTIMEQTHRSRSGYQSSDINDPLTVFRQVVTRRKKAAAKRERKKWRPRHTYYP